MRLCGFSPRSMGLLNLSCVLDSCYTEVEEMQVGSNAVEFNVRDIAIKSQDQLLAMSEKGLNILLSSHTVQRTRPRVNKILGSAPDWCECDISAYMGVVNVVDSRLVRFSLRRFLFDPCADDSKLTNRG